MNFGTQNNLTSAGVTYLLAVAAVGGLGTSARADVGFAEKRWAAEAKSCAELQGRMIGGAKVAAATFAFPPYTARWMNSTRTVSTEIPFCRLELYSSPTARSHIGIEVWLPARSAWNGRFLGVGAGGSLGDINRPDLAGAVTRGFAAVATDNGHRSASPRDGNQWAFGEPARVADFAYRGQRMATSAGKAAVRAYYGRDPEFSYYTGCSQGGHKAMLTAQRYPTDYDGILAGAPVFNWADEMTFQAWGVHALTATPESRLSVQQMRALNESANARCAGPNGLINDPLSCDADPETLRCPLPDGETCLTEEQITAVRMLYQGPRTSAGKRILDGYPRGSERGWEQFYTRVAPDGSEGGGSWLGVYRYMVHDDPSWNLYQMNFDRDPEIARQKLNALFDAHNPDLEDFAKSGAKLLMYQGWADQQIPAGEAVRYYKKVAERFGVQRTNTFFRLFMVAGMPHCFPESASAAAPGPRGPNLVPYPEYDASIKLTVENDALTALQQWVENGRAPNHFLVRLRDESALPSSISVRACAMPTRPEYGGKGDPRNGSNWSCSEKSRATH
jgi:feruloyl esterase